VQPSEQARSGSALPADLVAMRELLDVVTLTRSALARTLRMSVHDVAVMELLMLAGPGDELGPVELSRRLGVSSAATTQALTRLQEAGHLTREPHPGDRRRRVLRVTSSGRAHVLRALGPMLELLAAHSRRLSEEERGTVTRYLAGQTQAYRAYLALPGPGGDSTPTELPHR
jgi:DNA-binding MarR family transcriptional regulator